jgi:hypothetical protein
VRGKLATEAAEDLFDRVDVPAAVVCALCGSADCPGCEHDRSRSGIVALVAWERPGTPWLSRLWGTARATTLDAERFFESMPDGPVGPALRFAVTCELIAAAAMVGAVALPLLVIVPGFVREIAVEHGAMLVRELFVVVPSLAALLVGAHAAHGWALDRGARRVGARPARSRALRFGLYAAGWDLLIGPLGTLVVAFKEGPTRALSLGRLAFGLPARSARIYLRSAYKLDPDGVQRALRTTYAPVLLVTLLGLFAIASLAILALGA